MTNTAFTPNPDVLVTGKDQSEGGIRRHLVQILFCNLLRKKGISPEWLECRTALTSSRSRGEGVHIKLVLKQWDDLIMKYAFALQLELVADIERFEPQVSSWLHEVSWQLEVDDSYPYVSVPDNTFWQETKAMSMSVY